MTFNIYLLVVLSFMGLRPTRIKIIYIFVTKTYKKEKHDFNKNLFIFEIDIPIYNNHRDDLY